MIRFRLFLLIIAALLMSACSAQESDDVLESTSEFTQSSAGYEAVPETEAPREPVI